MNDEFLRKLKTVTDCSSKRIGNYNSVGKHLISVYEVKNYGQICFIRTKQDEACVFAPLFRDMPLVVGVLSGKEAEVRLIDTHTTENKIDFSSLKDVEKKFPDLSDLKKKSQWSDDLVLPESVFKKGKPDVLNQFLGQWFSAYIQLLREAPVAEELSKRRMIGIYSDSAMDEGGPIMELFRKDFKDDTEKANFFNQVVFATEEYSM